VCKYIQTLGATSEKFHATPSLRKFVKGEI
jgi:hypothetical protein